MNVELDALLNDEEKYCTHIGLHNVKYKEIEP